jgi:hypothetical protein
MKKSLFTALTVIISASSFSQSFITLSERTPEFNMSGDPITNIMDANGMQQGDWFYQDLEGNNVALKKFVDHKCEETYYSIDNKWVSSDNFESDASIIESLKELISSGLTQKGLSPTTSYSQLAIIIRKDGQIEELYQLGTWENTIVIDWKDEIQTVLNNANQNIENDTFILL